MEIFNNGIIIDGTGTAPKSGDIAFEDGRIVQVGQVQSSGKAYDLTGRYIVPGFIDSHSHNDWFCLRPDRNQFFDSFLSQGITTMITGNCGFSAVSCPEDSPYRDQLGGELFHLPPSARTTSTKDWRARLDGNSSVNVASLMGHGSARTAVVGLEQTDLTPEQEQQMLDILEQGLKEGAAGISLGLMYAPGIYAPMSELEKVAQLVAKYDRVLTIHPRAESAISLAYPMFGKSHLLRALDEITHLTKLANCRTVYSHLIFVGRRSWKDLEPALKVLEDMNQAGYQVGFDMYPYHFGASVITVVLPEWYQKLSRQERQKPLVRLKLRTMIEITTRLLGFGFSDITLAYAGETNSQYNGQTLTQVAKQLQMSEFDTYIKLCEDSDFKARVLMGSYQNDQIVERLMKHPLSVFMTDAWFEELGIQNEAIYQAFPLFLELGKRYNIPLEKVIRKMTSQTADRYQLTDRGVIKTGMAADFVVLNQDSLAIEQVYVNGNLAYDHQTGLNPERDQFGLGLAVGTIMKEGGIE